MFVIISAGLQWVSWLIQLGACLFCWYFPFFSLPYFFVVHGTTHADDSCLSTLFAYTPGFLGLCVVVVVPPLLVGQSFYGRETADDILKAALLPVIGAVSWLSFKSRRTSSDTSQFIEAAEEVAAAARALAKKNNCSSA